MKSNRILMTIFSLMVIASMLLAGCGGGQEQAASGEKTKSVFRFPISRPNAGRTKKF